MALDPKKVKKADTDEWWIVRLSKMLGERLPKIHENRQWFEGNPPSAFADTDQANWKRLADFARLNLAEMIVNSMLYRMELVGVRTGAQGDENGDLEARRIMKENNLDVAIPQALEWMLSLSVAYLSVGSRKDENDETRPLITAEHPAQMISVDDPDNPGRALAALKIYRDDIHERDVAVLYRSGYERVLVREGKTTLLPNDKSRNWRISHGAWSWEFIEGVDEDREENEQGKYTADTKYPPIYKLANRAGSSEFEKHIPTMRRINHTILQRMIIVAFQAFRQRGVKGVPNTNDKGKEIDYTDIFAQDPGAVWILPATADFWESGQADLGPVLMAVKDDLLHLMVTSMTPMFNVVPDAANGSAEGAALQREGLLFKTKNAIKRADSPVSMTFAAAFEILEDSLRSTINDIELMWASPRMSSLTERAVSAVQARTAGTPWRTIMTEFMELTPLQVAQAEQQRIDDSLFNAMYGVDPMANASNMPGMTDVSLPENSTANRPARTNTTGGGGNGGTAS